MTKAFVPKGLGTDKKSGEPFEYGGVEITLHDCEVCQGVYADIEQHGGTTFHKIALLGQVPSGSRL